MRLLLLLTLVACANQPKLPDATRTVPNETPEPRYERSKSTEQSSSAEIKRYMSDQVEALEERSAETIQIVPPSPQKEESVSPVEEDPFPGPAPFEKSASPFPPLKAMPAPKPSPSHVPTRKKDSLLDEPPPFQRAAGGGSGPARQGNQKPKPRPTGKRPFAVTKDQKQARRINEIVPPGEFFHARLVGTVEVGLFSPMVFAEVLDPNYKPVGTAVGQANLHRSVRNRAMITFSQLHLTSGETVRGSLEALDLNLSQGLIGRVDRRGFARFLRAFVEATLGALALNRSDGDGFASLFRINLSSILLGEAQREIEAAQLDRIIHLERDQAFFLASRQALTVREEPTNRALDTLTTSGRKALEKTFNTGQVAQKRAEALMGAYQELERKLRGGAPDHDYQ